MSQFLQWLPVAINMRVLEAVITIMITVLATAGAYQVIGRGRPLVLSDCNGSITPDKASAVLTILGGMGFLFAGAWTYVAQNGGAPAVGLALMGFFIAAFMAPSLTHLHDLSWNEDGVEGSSNLFGLTLGLARERIAWRDIATRGAVITGYSYVQSADGRRIYWSPLYKGYKMFEFMLEARMAENQQPLHERSSAA